MAGRLKIFSLLAIVILVVLATTRVWNPWPNVWTWVNTSKPIAGDSSRWQQRIGGSPQSVTIADNAVIVEYRTSIDAFDLTAGVKLWNNNADWAAVAGQGTESVVVTGRLLTKGYQVLDPRTGTVMRDEKDASAVWTYQDAILDLHCGRGNECQLTEWDPHGTTPKWTVDTGGIGFVLDAANPDLPDTRQLTATNVDDQVAGPKPLPALIGLPDDGKVRVIDTATGKVAQVVEPGRDQRVALAGGRVLTITGTPRDGTCYYNVVASDPPGGTVWRKDGLNLRTADGSDCKQKHDPAGGEDVVLGVDPVGREELLAAHDGRILWHGAPGENVLAVDDQSAVIRTADKSLLRGYNFSRGRTAWARQVTPNASAALTPNAVIIVTRKPGRVTALSRTDGHVLSDVRTDAKVFAVGSGGMIAVSGRDMAYVPFG